MKILFVTYEPHPTFRPDVATLFGKYLPRSGITSDLVTDTQTASDATHWDGGRALLAPAASGRLRRQVKKAMHGLTTVARLAGAGYTAVQVRDLPITAAIALYIARWKRVPFFYWMSFPLPESQIIRARAMGPRGGMRYWFPLLQGLLGKFALDRVVLPRADHVFVQSDHMRADLACRGVPSKRMTAVPMGVDLELTQPAQVTPSDDPRLRGKRVIVHLGVLERQRASELLLEVIALARQRAPDVVLAMVGDTDPSDLEYRAELRARATELGIDDAVIWTGWLAPAEGWRYLAAAHVALSLIPRGDLFDCASPTKVVEYLAFGLPVVANDQPDQAAVIRDSGCGRCVPQSAEGFATAVLDLLGDPTQRPAMAQRGREYVAQSRSYEVLAKQVAAVYANLK